PPLHGHRPRGWIPRRPRRPRSPRRLPTSHRPLADGPPPRAPPGRRLGPDATNNEKETSMNFRLLAAAALFALAAMDSVAAADPTGVWLTQDGEAHIRVAKCGAAICGTVVWLKSPVDPET